MSTVGFFCIHKISKSRPAEAEPSCLPLGPNPISIMGETMKEQLLDSARSAIFKESERSAVEIKGYDFNRGVNYSELLKSMVSTGFQASSLGDAMGVVNEMLEWKLSDETLSDECSKEKHTMKNVLWTPSTVIARLGKEINDDESSYLYWAYDTG